jgi:ATP-dependent Clp protease ATP-binding subunit ClpA
MKIQTLIDLTIDRARKENAEHVLPEHLACELLLIPEIQASLISFGLKDIEKALYELESYTRKTVGSFSNNPTPSNMFEIIIKRAIAQALLENKKTPSSADVFFSMLRESETMAVKVLRKQGLNIDAMLSFHQGSIAATSPIKDKSKFSSTSSSFEKTKINSTKEGDKGIVTKNLDAYTENYITSAKNNVFMPCIGREKEIEQIIHTLIRKTKNSTLLVGAAGVGKSTIVEGFAKRVVDGNVPDSLKEIKVYSLDVNNIIAGAKHHGSFEERIKNIIDELQMVGNSVLFIDELQTIIGAGGSGNLDLATILKTAVSRGKVKIIGCVTEEDYRKYVDKDRALTRRFFKVEVNEPTKEECKEILKGVLPTLEKYYDVKISSSAVDAAIDLSVRYIFDRNLPDKAIDLIDSAIAREKLKHKGKKSLLISDTIIAAEVSNFVKISEIILSENEKTRLINLKDRLEEKIFGQSKAIDKLISTIYVSKSGLRNNEKTIANLLFQGPTAVGKTELAKELAKNLGLELVRFDLSAYQDKFTLSALIGSPPGYIGYGDGRAGDGLLINAIEKNPNCVLLLDEVEKAHPDVLNILLQVMDYGTLNSSAGKMVNFRNVVLIMTSNIGAEFEEKNRIGFGAIDNSDHFDETFKNFFRPEFRSRLDAVVKFNKLGYEQMELIVKKSFNELAATLDKSKISLVLSDNALKYLTQKAHSAASGARIVNSLIDEEIKTKLAKILIHTEKPNSKYLIDFVDNAIIVI